MHTTIRVIPSGLGLINSEENEAIGKWANDAFGNLAVCQAYQYTSGADYAVLAYSDNQLVGFAAIFKREIIIDNKPLNAGCIGSVVVSPQYRAKGHGSMVLRELERVIYNALSCDIGGLLCLEDTKPFYEKHGWRAHTGPVLVERSGDKVEWTEVLMTHTNSSPLAYDSPVSMRVAVVSTPLIMRKL